jgi:hypothetical protein
MKKSKFARFTAIFVALTMVFSLFVFAPLTTSADTPEVLFNLTELLSDSSNTSIASLTSNDISLVLYVEDDPGALLGITGGRGSVQVTNRQHPNDGLRIMGLEPGDVLNFTFISPELHAAEPVPTGAGGGVWGPRYDLWVGNETSGTAGRNMQAITERFAASWNSFPNLGELGALPEGTVLQLASPTTGSASPPNFTIDRFLGGHANYEFNLTVPAGSNLATVLINRGQHGDNPALTWEGVPHENLVVSQITVTGVRASHPQPPTGYPRTGWHTGTAAGAVIYVLSGLPVGMPNGSGGVGTGETLRIGHWAVPSGSRPVGWDMDSDAVSHVFFDSDGILLMDAIGGNHMGWYLVGSDVRFIHPVTGERGGTNTITDIPNPWESLTGCPSNGIPLLDIQFVDGARTAWRASGTSGAWTNFPGVTPPPTGFTWSLTQLTSADFQTTNTGLRNGYIFGTWNDTTTLTLAGGVLTIGGRTDTSHGGTINFDELGMDLSANAYTISVTGIIGDSGNASGVRMRIQGITGVGGTGSSIASSTTLSSGNPSTPENILPDSDGKFTATFDVGVGGISSAWAGDGLRFMSNAAGNTLDIAIETLTITQK